MKKFLSIMVLLTTVTTGFAGESLFGITDNSIGLVNTPYSAAGIARSYEVASIDSFQLNFTNYATWTQIANTTYSVNMSYRASFGDDGVESDYFNDMALFEGGYLAFPLYKKKLVLGMGLQPTSSVEQRLAYQPDETRKEEMLIKGGLSKAAFNVAYNPIPWLGIAIAYEYNFGKISKDYRLDYQDSALWPLTLKYDYRYYGHGMAISAYASPTDNINIGLTFRPPVNLSVRIVGDSRSEAVNKSSLEESTLPVKLNFGMEYRFNKRNAVGFDLIYQNWDGGYKINDSQADPYQNDYLRVGFGYEKRQTNKLFTKLADKIDYRAGLFYGQLNHTSNGNAVNEYGLSFGLSLPIQRFVSRIDLTGQVGKRGDLKNNAYEETFLRFGLTVSASERWFVNIDD